MIVIKKFINISTFINLVTSTPFSMLHIIIGRRKRDESRWDTEN